ncbi:hypothetical protein [Aggregatilinea lenta]|uniref:hypothetical protein n=1 Tax=Aggregatilinea lenta TaxID=913108 RepID=UPI000E5B9113|nr:hypothetical protein [Aggregatilinea lenta]
MSASRSAPIRRTRFMRVRRTLRPGVVRVRRSRRARHVTPLWTDLLAARGLSPATIAHFVLLPRAQGWTYPVHPAIEARRWKAFDSTARPKYRWLPGKPDGITFYDLDGRLAERVRMANGRLWLASGEADVWALWEGGIYNATCMFDGEAKRVPTWFTAQLARLGVRTLHIAPDCDPTGTLFAQRLDRTLADLPIRLRIHTLPFLPGSKGDIGRLLVQVGSGDLKPVLERLPLMALPDDEPLSPDPLPARPAEHGELYDLYEQWCVEEVEAAALRAWSISAPDERGFSRNFRCPFHDDTHPSAGWNYLTHGVHCFACGTHDTHEVAAALHVRTWEQFRTDESDTRSGKQKGA